jgi:flavodoxin
MAKVTMRGTGNVEEIAKELVDRIQESGMSCQLVDSSKRDHNILLIFEKYYMRAKNRASLSVMLTKTDSYIYADIIGSGGGQGVIFSFSWGAEGDFVDSAKSIMLQMEFEEEGELA